MSHFLDLALAIEDDDEARQLLLWQHQKFTVQSAIKNCRACNLHKTCRQRVPFFGDRNDLLVLGEAPGQSEDLKGIPFCGKSGSLLRETLKDNKLDPAIANTVCCRPPGNRDPKDNEALACRPHLEAQIEYINPWLILCVGKIPLKALRSDLRITRDRGYFFDIPGMKGRWGFATFHPAFVLRNPTLKPTFRADIRTVAAAIKVRAAFPNAEIADTNMWRIREWSRTPSAESREIMQGYVYTEQELSLSLGSSPGDFSGLYGDEA